MRGLLLTPLATQGLNAALESQVQKGEGLAWARGDRALLRERKENRRV